LDNSQLKKGVLINFIAKYSNILIQLILTSILARLLTPKEYGVISVIMIFITFFNLLGDMGIGPAIIQYKELSDDDLSSIFILTFIIAIFLGLIFFLFSYFIAYIYGSKVYISIGHLLCLSIILNTLCIVPNGKLYKNKEFKIIGVSTIISNLIAGIVAIFLAKAGFSYYSLAFNSIVQGIVNFSIIFRYSRVKIKINRFTFKPIKKISNYSTYQFLFNFLNYFSRNSDNLLIGKYIGMNQLGYYDKAYKLMLYPVQNLTFVITPVLQPILSDYQDDKETIFKHYKKIVKLLALIGAFISVFCFFSAKEIILIMYGNQWLESINSFKFLSISIIIQMVLSSSGSIYQATGNTKYLFINGFISAVTMVILIIAGIFLGKIEHVAALLVLGFIINFLQGYYILINKIFDKSFLNFLAEFKSSIVIILIMVILYNILSVNTNNYFIDVILKFIIGLAGYLIGLIITKENRFLKNAIFGHGRD
jgi:teichuronic acid exporter